MNLTASDSKIIQTPKPSICETHADSSILNWMETNRHRFILKNFLQ